MVAMEGRGGNKGSHPGTKDHGAEDLRSSDGRGSRSEVPYRRSNTRQTAHHSADLSGARLTCGARLSAFLRLGCPATW